MNKNLKTNCRSIGVCPLGLVLGAIIMWAFSYDALWGYELLFKKFCLIRVGEIFPVPWGH